MRMFQLGFRFLEQSVQSLVPPPAKSPPLQPDQPFAWKHGLTVRLIRRPRARRYLLRLQPDGTARLVIPRRGNRAEALRFLERSETWLRQRAEQWRARSAARQPWSEGTTFLFRGEPTVLHVEPLGGKTLLRFVDQSLEVSPGTDLRIAVLAHLRQMAERELPLRTQELAREHGVTIRHVTVRAQKTRWGSCSARGAISLNWRTIHAPPSVSDYLILHELMHRREMNHSRRYWKLVAAACPAYEAAERWLKNTHLEAMD
jgi:predicted metal-dependent hydrolase